MANKTIARFHAFQKVTTTDLDSGEQEEGCAYALTDSDARWDEILASEEGQRVLDKLADAALAEIRAEYAGSHDQNK